MRQNGRNFSTGRAAGAVRPRRAARAGLAGGWKIAYADFVTAMMAFFLLLWIAEAAGGETRAELAGYFRGEAAPAGTVTLPATGPDVGVDVGVGEPAQRLIRRFEAAPELKSWASQIRLEAAPGELRLDLVDGADEAMFARGSAELAPQAARLLAALAPFIAETGARIEIEGHTDAVPVAASAGSNWTLGAARAEAARRALQAAGLPADRIEAVTGRADRLPVEGVSADSGTNRRIRLIFLL